MIGRLFGFLGMGGVFLTISPKLRYSLLDGIAAITHEMELYAPYSYIAGAVLVLLALMMSLYRGAQPQ